MTASEVLTSRWPDALVGEIQKHNGQMYRRSPYGWARIDGKVADHLYRLNGATNLWRTDKTRLIGMQIVYDLVAAMGES
jgi:hypothetical protein